MLFTKNEEQTDNQQAKNDAAKANVDIYMQKMVNAALSKLGVTRATELIPLEGSIIHEHLLNSFAAGYDEEFVTNAILSHLTHPLTDTPNFSTFREKKRVVNDESLSLVKGLINQSRIELYNPDFNSDKIDHFLKAVMELVE